MVKFLIQHPIGVIMFYLAIIIIGITSTFYIPISLMPETDIPEISIYISYPNSPARELENSITKTVRNQLMQISHLQDIESETRDGNAVIKLKFHYGTQTQFAYIEVNEKIDALMNLLPRDMERPKVIKASATDIPVFNLNITLKNDSTENFTEFLALSEFCENVIKKRIEQLPEIAIADISGTAKPQIIIKPDIEKINALNITFSNIEQAVNESNMSLGSLLVKDGHYVYNVRFSNELKTIEDVENIYINVSDKILKLNQIAKIYLQEQKQKGIYTINGKRSIAMQIIKQADAQMYRMKDVLQQLLIQFKTEYPQLEFTTSQDQTALLDFSISNMKQNLVIGAFLAFLVMFLFLGNLKSPLIIGVTIPVSLIISLLFFWLFHISINIVSLSGLILGVGMMIDNSIIVIDNIAQYNKQYQLQDSCERGTNEVIKPLLSSVLTTCAVFLPLIFLSGIAGALFYDQAMGVTIGLFSSLLVAITLIPTIYNILYRNKQEWQIALFSKFYKHDYSLDIYKKIHQIAFRKPNLSIFLCLMIIPLSVIMYNVLPKELMPQVESHELIIEVDWNEPISISENRKRSEYIISCLPVRCEQNTMEIGEQDFLTNHGRVLNLSETKIYLKMLEKIDKTELDKNIKTIVLQRFPNAIFKTYPVKNVFEQLFGDKKSPLELKISNISNQQSPNYQETKEIIQKLQKILPNDNITIPPQKEYFEIKILTEKLLLYNVDFDIVVQKLKTIFNENRLGILKSSTRYIPINLAEQEADFRKKTESSFVKSTDGADIRLLELIDIQKCIDFKSILSGKEGEYLLIKTNTIEKNENKIKQSIKKTIGNHFQISFSGSNESNRKMFIQFAFILMVAILLLYFILASQFESFVQPLIVLAEIPIDIAGALVVLFIFGASINLMSVIGIIVMSGIIINDSILKIATINHELKYNKLSDAIEIAGKRRIKSILMTSMTTILAILPFLFSSGLGSDLQRPLSYSLIGGMVIGTFISLYFIPLVFYKIYNKK